MANKKHSSILEGLEDAVAYAAGDASRGRQRRVKVPNKVDVVGIYEPQ